MAEYGENDLAKLPKIDKATGKNLETGVISVEEAKRLSDLAANGGAEETEDQRVAREAQEEADRQAEAARIAAGGKPAVTTTTVVEDEDKVIKVGGVEKKRSEWLEEFQTDRGIDVSTLDPSLQDNLLNDFINSKHKAAWQQNLTQKSEELSARRKEVEADARAIDQKKADLATKRTKLEAEQKRLREQSSKGIKKEDLYDEHERIDPDKQFEYQQMKQAQADLPRIEAELAQLEQEVVQTGTDRLFAQMELVQTTHPQLSTSKPIKTVVDEIENQKLKDHPDNQKYLDLLEVSDYSQAYGLSMEQAAERLIQQGRLLSVRENNEPMKTTLTDRNTAQERFVSQVSRNQQTVPAKLPAGGAPPRVQIQPKADLAQEMRKASSKASGGGNSDALSKSGY